jgi:hypothetical protein
VKLARLRWPKTACSLSYVDCRPKTNAAILWGMGHTKGRLCKGGIGQGKETKNLRKRLMCSLHNEYRNFKLTGATMGSGLGRNEEGWKRRINWSYNTHMHGTNTRKLCSYLYLKLAKDHFR